MRKLMFVAIVAALMLSTTVAFAAGSVTRAGRDFSGIRQTSTDHPCVITDEGEGLDVKCTKGVGAVGPVYIRYRFLSDVGASREFADVSADVKCWVGSTDIVEWMIAVPRNPARTLRITVPNGSYCDIRTVSWSQA